MLEQLYPFSDGWKRFHLNGCCSRVPAKWSKYEWAWRHGGDGGATLF